MVQLNIKKKNSTFNKLEELTKPMEMRPYLGMSKLGHPCSRYLWYSFRWCFTVEIEARKKRFFMRGHREEPAIIHELQQIGIKFHGAQLDMKCAFGHCKGHNDEVCSNVPEAPKTMHLAEFKTMSDKYFKKIVKEGVKVSKPIYYAQTQIYMKHLELTRCLFVAVNKNDDSFYIERIKYDKAFADDLERKAEAIILSEEPLDKAFEPTWYECKYCDARPICHSNGIIHKTCRTCNNVDLLPEGEWACSRYDGLNLCTEQQLKACDNYELLNTLKGE